MAQKRASIRKAWKQSKYIELQQGEDMVTTGWAQFSKLPTLE